MRGFEIYPPAPNDQDNEKVEVSRRTLRELQTGIHELLRGAESFGMSDLGEEPDDLLFLRAAADVLCQLLCGSHEQTHVEPGSRQLGLLNA